MTQDLMMPVMVYMLTIPTNLECDTCEQGIVKYILELEPGALPSHEDTLLLCEGCLLKHTAEMMTGKEVN